MLLPLIRLRGQTWIRPATNLTGNTTSPEVLELSNVRGPLRGVAPSPVLPRQLCLHSPPPVDNFQNLSAGTQTLQKTRPSSLLLG